MSAFRNLARVRVLTPGHEFEFSEIFVQHRTAIGRKIWAIAEGYIPSGGISGDRKLTPHETACILNAGDEDAQITITLYFTDREPVGPYRVRVPARRTLHLQFNDLRDPEPFRSTPIMRRSSNRMFRSSCSTRGSIPVIRISRCFQPSRSLRMAPADRTVWRSREDSNFRPTV